MTTAHGKDTVAGLGGGGGGGIGRERLTRHLYTRKDAENNGGLILRGR
jgi:hypothetical protein